MADRKAKARRIRPKPGDVFQIPLPDGRFAYGRVFRDASVGIYKQVSAAPQSPPDREEFAFIVGLYKDVLTSGRWPIIGRRPFPDEDAAWPPPKSIKDPISGRYSLYHKGEIRPASPEECAGLERAAVWDAHHVIDRIQGSDKWQNL